MIKSLNGILMSSLVLQQWLNLRENFFLKRFEITVHQFFSRMEKVDEQ